MSSKDSSSAASGKSPVRNQPTLSLGPGLPFTPTVRIGSNVRSIAEASRPIPVNVNSASKHGGRFIRSHKERVVSAGDADARQTNTFIPTAPSTMRPARLDASRTTARKLVSTEAAADKLKADASFLSGRREKNYQDLRRLQFPPFLQFLETSTNGVFRKEVLESGGFAYFQVHSNIFDVTWLDSTATGIYMSDRENAKRGYITVSSTGISHIYGDGMDFYPLEEFETSFLRYQRMRKLPLFQHYKPWRAFYAWKSAVLQARFDSRTSFLNRSLFMLNPVLRDALTHINTICLQIVKLPLYHLDTHTHSLREWLELQEATHARLHQSLLATFSNIRRIALRAAAVSLDDHMALHGFTAHPLEGTLAQFMARGEAEPSKMASSQQRKMLQHTTFATPRDVKYTMRAAARSYCRRLMRFIRLADLSVHSALLQLAYTGTQALWSFMIANTAADRQSQLSGIRKSMKAGAAAAPMFITDLQARLPGVDDVVQSPRADHTAALVEQLWETADQTLVIPFQTIVSMDGLYFTPNADTYRSRIEAISVDGLRIISQALSARLAASEDFRVLREAMLSKVDGAGDEDAVLSTEQSASIAHARAVDSESDNEKEGAGDTGDAPAGESTFAQDIADQIARARDSGDRSIMDAGDSTDAAGQLTLLLEDEVITRNFEGVVEAVNQGFLTAVSFAGGLQKYRHIAIIDGIIMEKLTLERLENTPVAEINAALDEFSRQIKICAEIPASSDICSLFRIDSARFQKQIQPVPQQAYDMVIELLPQAAHRKASVLLENLLNDISRLKQDCHSVQDYVQLVKSMTDVQNKMQDYIDAEDWLRDTRRVLEARVVRITDETRSVLLSVVESGRLLRDALSAVEEKHDVNTVKYGKELEVVVPRLKAAVAEARRRADDLIVHKPSADAGAVVTYLQEVAQDVKELQDRANVIGGYQDTLHLTATPFDEVKELASNVDTKLQVWQNADSWNKDSAEWSSSAFHAIDLESVEQVTKTYLQKAAELAGKLSESAVVSHLQEQITTFHSAIPVMKSLRNSSLRTRHLLKLNDIIKFDAKDPALRLQDILSDNVLKHARQIVQIAVEASAEFQLEEELSGLINKWNQIELGVRPHPAGRDAMVIGDVNPVQQDVQDTLVQIARMLGSRFVSPLRVNVESMQTRLQTLEKILDDVKDLQEHWMYLEPVFFSMDIQRSLGHEAKSFASADMAFRELVRKIRDEPIALGLSARQGLPDTLRRHVTSLESVRAQLSSFLDSKRSAFPRLFFLSNDQVLDILSRVPTDPRAINTHISKLFDAAAHLAFEDSRLTAEGNREGEAFASASGLLVSGFVSAEGEVAALGKNAVRVRGSPEDWLRTLEDAMQTTMKQSVRTAVVNLARRLHEVQSLSAKITAQPIRRSIQYGPTTQAMELAAESKCGWVVENLGHVALLASQVHFCNVMEEILRCRRSSEDGHSTTDDTTRDDNTTNGISEASLMRLRVLQGQMNADLSAFSHVLRSPLTTPQRHTFISLSIWAMHNRDILESVLASNIDSSARLRWDMQLRFTLKGEDEEEQDAVVSVQHGLFRADYGYEYVAPTQRLVVTPLTERCWLALTSALIVRQNVALYGPAGTGKSETVKDLSRALGVNCVAFGCSEQVDFATIGRLCAGACQTGAWLCLDEINRLHIDVLSYASSVLLQIADACNKHHTNASINLLGLSVPVQSHAIVVTYNPLYAGRITLPDTFKNLLRPCQVCLPDTRIIAEVLLHAEGFQESLYLSDKVTTLLSFCESQLPVRDCYDWGLCMLKNVIAAAGCEFRRYYDRDVAEIDALMNACAEVVTARLITEDHSNFYGILQDCFIEDLKHITLSEGGVLIDITGNPRYLPWLMTEAAETVATAAVRSVCARNGKFCTRQIIDKSLQIMAAMRHRMGVAVLGGIASGKSHLIALTAQAVNQLRKTATEDEARVQSHVAAQLRRLSSIRTDVSDVPEFDVSTVYINPKVLSLDDLYGRIDATTCEWRDGLLTRHVRSITQANTSTASEKGRGFPKSQTWVVLDGPVDPLWVESMNPALDDTRVLCLANNERIKLDNRVRFVYELVNLGQASPATVTRLGVVSVEASTVTPVLLLEHFLNRAETTRWLSDKGRARLHSYAPMLEKCAAFAKQERSSSAWVPTEVELTLSFIAMLQTLLMYRPEGWTAPPFTLLEMPSAFAALDRMFTFALVWSFGAALAPDRWPHFDTFLRDLFRKTSFECGLQSSGSVFDYYLKIAPPKGSNTASPSGSSPVSGMAMLDVTFRPWQDHVKPFDFLATWQSSAAAAGTNDIYHISELYVDTVDTAKVRQMLHMVYRDTGAMSFDAPAVGQRPILLFGNGPAGKTFVLRQFRQELLEMAAKKDSSFDVTPTIRECFTMSPQLQLASLQKSFRNLFAPNIRKTSRHTSERPLNDTAALYLSTFPSSAAAAVTTTAANAILWVEDLHMTPVENSNKSQPIAELLRQCFDYGGYQDGCDYFTHISDCTFVATADLSASAEVPNRLFRHFTVLGMPSLEGERLANLLKPIVAGYFQSHTFGVSFAVEIKRMSENLALATVAAAAKLSTELRTSPLRMQYQYTCYEIKQVVDGLSFLLPPKCEDVHALAEVWFHECLRVWADRTTERSHQITCANVLAETAAKFLHVSLDPSLYLTPDEVGPDVMVPVVGQPISGYTDNKATTVTYGFFGHKDEGFRAGEVVYERYGKLSDLSNRIHQVLEAFRMEQPKKAVNVALFYDAVAHILRCARALTMSPGHAALSGVSGTGRRTCAELACVLSGIEFKQLDIDLTSDRASTAVNSTAADSKAHATTQSAHENFRAFLRDVVWRAGVDCRPVALFVRQSYISDADAFEKTLDRSLILEDVYLLMTTGHLSDLFEAVQAADIVRAIRQQADVIIDEDTYKASATDKATEKSDGNARRPMSGKRLPTNNVFQLIRDPASDFLIDATSAEKCWAIFLARLRRNLHVILSLDDGEGARAILKRYPRLKHVCGWDYYSDWNSSALLSIAKVRLETATTFPSAKLSKKEQEALAQAATNVYKLASRLLSSCRADVSALQVTPGLYMDSVDCFLRTWAGKQGKIHNTIARLERGMSTLEATGQIVAQLKEQLSALQPVLAAKRQQASALLQEVDKQSFAARTIASKVAEEETEVAAQADAAAAVQADAQRELDAAMPALNAAMAAVDALDKASINEIKSYAVAPPAVRTVMEAVCVLLGKETDWETARRVLGSDRPTFQQMLLEFDKDNISASTLKKLSRYTTSSAMAVEAVKKVSVAAASVAAWVHAVELYNAVAKEVAPKQAKLADMNAKLAEANAALAAKRAQLELLHAELVQLQGTADTVTAERDKLERDSATAQVRLNRAHQLLSILGAEGVRWRREVERLKATLPAMTGDLFLSAMYVTYAGRFPADARSGFAAALESVFPRNAESKSDILFNRPFRLRDVAGDDVLIRDWQAHGLPKDDSSSEAALLVAFGSGVHVGSKFITPTGGSKWPLCIDPEGQAERWITYVEGGSKAGLGSVPAADAKGAVAKVTANKVTSPRPVGAGLALMKSTLDIISMDHPSLSKTLEHATKTGRTVIIQNCCEPMPVAVKRLCAARVRRSQDTQKESQTAVEVDPNFRMYLLCSRMENVGASMCMFANVVDFTTARTALEDHLLSTILGLARPAVEQRINQLLNSVSADRKQLLSIEDNVLALLTDKSDSDSTTALHALLDDTQLVSTLQTSRNLAAVIAERVAEAEKSTESLLAIRELYRPLAHRGALLYMVMKDARVFHPVYQFGLPFFEGLFVSAVKTEGWVASTTQALTAPSAQEQRTLQADLANVQSVLTRMVYQHVTSAMYRRHVCGFVLMLAATIDLDARGLQAKDCRPLQLLLRGKAPAEAPTTNPPPETARASPRRPEEPKRVQELVPVFPADFTEAFSGLDLDSDAQSTLFDAISTRTNSSGASGISHFTNLPERVRAAKTTWMRWQKSPQPYKDIPVTDWSSTTDANSCIPLCKLLLVRVFCPASLNDAISEYADDVLDNCLRGQPRFTMTQVAQSTPPNKPILVLCSDDSDPVKRIQRTAEEIGIGLSLDKPIPDRDAPHLVCLTLPQCTVASLEHAVNSASTRGDWLLIQDCQLAPHLLPTISKLAVSITERQVREKAPAGKSTSRQAANAPGKQQQQGKAAPAVVEDDRELELYGGGFAPLHPSFKLFLATEASDALPPLLLDVCAKWVDDSPVDANEKAFQMVQSMLVPFLQHMQATQTDISMTELQLLYRSVKLLVALSRRAAFVPVGFLEHYRFTAGDLDALLKIIHTGVSHSVDGDLQPVAVFQMIAAYVTDIMLGCRCVNDSDRSIIRALFELAVPASITDNYSELIALPTAIEQMTSRTVSPLIPNIDCQQLASVDDSAQLVGGIRQTFETLHLCVKSARLSSLPSSRVLHTATDLVDVSLLRTLLAQTPELLNVNALEVASRRLRRDTVSGFDALLHSKAASSHPTISALVLECTEYNDLLVHVRSTLSRSVGVLEGYESINSAIEEILAHLSANTVPPSWMVRSFPHSGDLRSWWVRLLANLKIVSAAIAHLRSGGELTTIHLPACINARRLVRAVMQGHGRISGVSTDLVVTRGRISEVATSASSEPLADDAMLMTGLRLEGAEWTPGGATIKTHSGGSLRGPELVLRVKCAHADSLDEDQATDGYACPVYATPSRIADRGFAPSLLMHAPLPVVTSETKMNMRLRGVALVSDAGAP